MTLPDSYPEPTDTIEPTLLLKGPVTEQETQATVSEGEELGGVAVAQTVDTDFEARLILAREQRAARERTPEKRLVRTFDELLANHPFEEVVVPVSEGAAVNTAQYRFIPLVNRELVVSRVRGGNVLPEEPTVETTSHKGMGPFLDARQGIGLVYGNKLIAVGAACIDEQKRLLINQLQDVTEVRRPKRGGDWSAYNSTGLNNGGFWWRDTLARAWESIAIDLGVETVVIQDDSNSYWKVVKGSKSTAMAQTALRLGYKQNEEGNWTKTLSTRPVAAS